MRPTGVWAATPTFFTAAGRLDEAALDQHLDRLARAGVHGFVPCGTTGEAATLDSEEWRQTVMATIRLAKPRGIPVMAGCGGNDTAVALKRINEARSLGADCALVVCPYYNKPTAEGLEAHFSYLAKEGDLPIVLYNIPGRTCVNLSPDSVARLFALDSIIGLKESTGNLSQWIDIAEKTDLSRKVLLAGDDNAVAPVMALGGTGVVSVAANVDPERFVELYDLGNAGKWEEAFALQVKLNPLIRSLFLETNPAPVKHALFRMHGLSPSVRLPLVGVTSPTAASIEACLRRMELLT